MQEQLDGYFSDLSSKYQCSVTQSYGSEMSFSYDRKTEKNRDKKDVFASVQQIYQKPSTASLIICSQLNQEIIELHFGSPKRQEIKT